MTGEITRFAPSPTGFLHLGHAFAALFAEAAARETGGRFLLRIEDIDATRARPEYERAIEEDLVWLDLAWERPVRRQSEHFADYATALEKLKAKGLLYPCFCTRKEIASEIAESVIAPQGPDGPLYPGTCRQRSSMECSERIESGESHAWRLDVERAIKSAAQTLVFDESGLGPSGEKGQIAAHPEIFGDAVLGRKDTPASYHLAVVVDDALQGVTLVTRGNDLFQATHLQRLLQALLRLFAVQKLRNLPRKAADHVQKFLVSFAKCCGKEFYDAMEPITAPNWKGERGVQPRIDGIGGAREIVVARHVGNPLHPSALPHSARQPDSHCEITLPGAFDELRAVGVLLTPDLGAAQYLHLLIHPPQDAHIPIQGPADPFQDAWNGFLQCVRLQQQLSDGVFRSLAMLLLLARGDVINKGEEGPFLTLPDNLQMNLH